MPELPEVEIARLCLQRWGKGRHVRGITVHDPRVVANGAPALRPLVGARFANFDRRGKNLLITLDKGRSPLGLWSHLGMTGKWVRRSPREEAPKFSRVELALDDDQVLHYADMRLFGRLRVVPGAAFEALPELRDLGPDPLREGLPPARLAEALARRKVPVKVALLDQSVVAGVGNIQASEALFRARLDPRRTANALKPDEVRRLATGIRASIAHTLKAEGADRLARGRGDITYVEEPGGPNPFVVYDREGESCPRCGRGPITRIVQAGRASYYCPSCQR